MPEALDHTCKRRHPASTPEVVGENGTLPETRGVGLRTVVPGLIPGVALS